MDVGGIIGFYIGYKVGEALGKVSFLIYGGSDYLQSLEKEIKTRKSLRKIKILGNSNKQDDKDLENKIKLLDDDNDK